MATTATVTVPIRAMKLSPGSHLLIENVSWQQYEALLAEFDEDRLVPRINYCHSALELTCPLPIRERPNRIMTDIVKTILDVQDRDWEDFGSTTFQKVQQAGLEPDTCFYIQNAERMRNCERFDATTDPPPDLAIESDVTSRTTLETYQILQVPEVWIYDRGELSIYILKKGQYHLSESSSTFPSIPIAQVVPQWIAQAKEVGTRKMLKQLRNEIT